MSRSGPPIFLDEIPYDDLKTIQTLCEGTRKASPEEAVASSPVAQQFVADSIRYAIKAVAPVGSERDPKKLLDQWHRFKQQAFNEQRRLEQKIEQLCAEIERLRQRLNSNETPVRQGLAIERQRCRELQHQVERLTGILTVGAKKLLSDEPSLFASGALDAEAQWQQAVQHVLDERKAYDEQARQAEEDNFAARLRARTQELFPDLRQELLTFLEWSVKSARVDAPATDTVDAYLKAKEQGSDE